MNDSNFICACLLVISEIFKCRNELYHLSFKSQQSVQETKDTKEKNKQLNLSTKIVGDADDDEEVFLDADKLES
jgi:hypothetical protein